MATYGRTNEVFSGIFFDQLNWQLTANANILNTGDQLHFVNTDGLITGYNGSGLTVDGSDIPQAGTVDQITLYSFNGVTLTQLVTITNFGSLNFVDIYNQVQAGTFFETLFGGSDTVNGGTQDDTLLGFGGADTINGGDGNDTIDGGGGGDSIIDNAGTATAIDGGVGNDLIKIGSTFTSGTIDGGADTDTLEVILDIDLSVLQITDVETLRVGFNGSTARASQFQAFDTIEHTNGTAFPIDLTLVATGSPTTLDLSQKISNVVNILGTTDAETITAGQLNDSIQGEAGDDTLDGGAGLDFVDGGGGDDTITSKAGEGGPGEQLSGGEDHDLLIMDRSNETIAFNFDFGDANGDTYLTLDCETQIRQFQVLNFKSGSGDDIITGGDFEDVIDGGAGNDTLNDGGGVNAADTLLGGAGNDTLNGGDGGDILRGGAGADNLFGGADNDAYQIAGSEGIGDTITDTGGLDQLQLVGNAVLTGFNAAALSLEQLACGGFTLSGTGAGNTFDFSGATGVGLAKINAAGGNDVIRGTQTADVITGGKGKDSLGGGLGADNFDFNSIKDSLKGAKRDTVIDFKHSENDKIDLVGIDAKTGVAGNQKFTWIGKNDFHDKKGELHYVKHSGSVWVEGDVNGDGNADFEIKVSQVGSLAKGDFLL